MPAEITIRDDGFAEAVFSREPAWHGLGQVLDHNIHSKEAIEKSGLNWNVVQRPMAYRVETPEGAVYHDLVEKTIDADINRIIINYVGKEEKPKGMYSNIRQDTGLFLGVVSNQYKVVQNLEAFQFMDKLIENHEIRYESAFSLYGGKRVVLLAQLPKVDFIVEKDPLLRYILLSLSHDGTAAIKFGPTSIRIVCANTHSLALKKDSKSIRELSISHKGNITDKLKEARQILSLAHKQFEVYAGIAQQLAKKQLTVQEWERFLDIVCPSVDEADASVSKRTKHKVKKIRAEISDSFINGECQNIIGIERTGWAAYNSIAEIIDHLPRRGKGQRQKAEARFNTILYGSGMTHKEHAMETICNLCGVEYSLSV